MTKEELEQSEAAKRAMALFREGYNCSQAVVLAFEEEFTSRGIDSVILRRMSSSFGGGMGRLREVCGSVSGMFLTAGLLYGYEDSKDYKGKAEHYERIQALAAEFRKIHGSIVCRELLGLADGPDSPNPEQRTEAYYKKRPCVEIVGTSAAILEAWMKEHQLTE